MLRHFQGQAWLASMTPVGAVEVVWMRGEVREKFEDSPSFALQMLHQDFVKHTYTVYEYLGLCHPFFHSDFTGDNDVKRCATMSEDIRVSLLQQRATSCHTLCLAASPAPPVGLDLLECAVSKEGNAGLTPGVSHCGGQSTLQSCLLGYSLVFTACHHLHDFVMLI